ncbi:hypothetical protein PTE30175_01519 [Pandoraea terrae]|uniref:Uncharacterized protein n=1 Tax=Pandoraea terrae TaxID=1537710 RepID=A0A5E4TUS5_9BURK|nr:hypothetical protein [Pandoraea terrae]VVD90344.1 hypothetical protein PTE30175_01519 [Pandoraea terrae]
MPYILPFYKGFEIETLVYPQSNGDGFVSRRDRTYGVAVKISRAVADVTDKTSRVFKLKSQTPFESVGEARRAGDQFGQSIVDGKIDDMSIHDL